MGRLLSRAVVAVGVVGLAALALPNAPVTAAGPDTSPATVGSARTYGSWLMVSSNGERVLNDTTKHALVGLDASTKKVSRPYYRFSTSALAGKHILSATFQHKLIHSPNTDCSLTSFGPAVEVGRTANFTSTTAWPGPAWLQTLGSDSTVHGVQGTCPGAKTPEWDVESGLEAVAAARQPVVVLGLRSADEKNADGWRIFDNATEDLYPNLVVEYNTPPNVPSQLKLRQPSLPCGSETFPTAVSAAELDLQALVTDPDTPGGFPDGGIFGRFELTAKDGGPVLWTAEGLATSSGSITTAHLAEGLLVNGSAYRLRVRAEQPTEEGTDLSAWSPWCHFKIDRTRPPMPKVYSDDYPEMPEGGGPPSGGVGVPGTFTVSGGLRSDAVVYTYRFDAEPIRTVRPAMPGGAVTLTYTPSQPGPRRLTVYASDLAGNPSDERTYFFNVASG